jgi:hypothetical protein
MDKLTRNAIERATQQGRKVLDEDFSSQLEGTFDVLRTGVIASKAGTHLSALQKSKRDKIVAAIEHKRAGGMTALEAVTDYVRDAAFTTLNRFVALKMLEARELVQECITKGEHSAGYREFCGMAPGLALLPEAAGYRLYIESLFDEFSTEIKVLFDRRDVASVLWPKRQTFDALLAILNAQELSAIWGEDETIGWVYQFFNSSEERRKMRDESQAPRNSRELAARNQFFTPRYVVQFLTDNTLGRLWLEMHGEKTRLKTICEYFVPSAGEPVQDRPRKDPRDLRVLDPACGSGHFLLYSFDLLLTIYEEAWAAEETAPASEATGRTLREDYPDATDLRHAAPKLIVEQNLYGVDIDPRCAQIAALALWLRAQRAWKDLGAASSKWARIHRTHIVVAEPMPGDAALVDEFAARLDPPLLRDLFKKMVGESRLAGELGVLLRVEDGIAAELSRAREQFVKQRQSPGFFPGMEPVPGQGSLDLSGIDDDSFFHEAEARIVEVSRGFAETAINGASARRRLFAGDAAQGIALIDLERTRFDVVLMNPPFGASSIPAKKEFETAYPRTKNDLYAAFVERGSEFLHPHGLLGAITSRTGFFLSSFQKWREEILLKEAPPVVFADLGYGVLDSAMVEVAAYCLGKESRGVRMKTVFLRVLKADDKAAALRAAISEPPEAAGNRQRFESDARSFEAVPRSPFAYWVSEKLLAKFGELDPVEFGMRTAKIGPSTGDDGRYVRSWWEVGPKTSRPELEWVPFAKGGSHSPYYADIHLIIAWEPKRRTFFGFTGRVGRETERPNSLEYFRRPGLTWPLRTQVGLALRAMPAGCIFGHKGPTILVDRDDSAELLALLGITNSKPFRALVDLQMAFGSYEVGVIQRTPVPTLTPADLSVLSTLARRAWSLKRVIDECFETSHAFLQPALLRVEGDSLLSRANAWVERVHAIDAALAAIDRDLDARCFDLYGISENDRCAITDGFAGSADASVEPDNVDTDTEEEGDAEANTDGSHLAADLIAWAVGVAFGRFDVHLVTVARSLPTEPEPFDRLPASSPGMLTGDDGLPLAVPPAGYPLAFPENGILVHDPGQANDLTAAVRKVFDEVFGGSADASWNEATAMLDPQGQKDLRAWLGSSFFEHHLKRHSKSRRKAPIIWQLAVPSGRYSIWLYAHRLTRDSFFQIQNDVVTSKLTHEERQLTSLIQSAGQTPSAKERREIVAQETFIDELRALLDEVKRVAPLWNPMLDDGIVLTMAPLWRLVPQHKLWQKELKSKWEDLALGKYDWAHLAMHLWPERVIPKCASDRSLAIAHGLENVFWDQDANSKWKTRSTPSRTVDELILQRSSPAVKAALKILLESPDSVATSRRRRRDIEPGALP